MIGMFRVLTEEDRTAWIMAHEIGAFYETSVIRKPGPGRPPADGPKGIPVIMFILRNGSKLAAKGESIDSVVNKMCQAMGVPSITMVSEVAYEPGREPKGAAA